MVFEPPEQGHLPPFGDHAQEGSPWRAGCYKRALQTTLSCKPSDLPTYLEVAGMHPLTWHIPHQPWLRTCGTPNSQLTTS